MIAGLIEDTTMRLPSGRALAFTTWGDPGGVFPLVSARPIVAVWPDVGHLGVARCWDEVLAAIHPQRCSLRSR